MAQQQELMTSGAIARLLGVSNQRVQQLVQEGVLVPVNVTTTGMRLFAASDVEQLRREREQKPRKAAAKKPAPKSSTTRRTKQAK